MKKILLSVAVASFVFIGCSDESKEEAKAVANKSIDTVAKVVEETQSTTTKIVEEVKEKTSPMVEEVKEKAKEVVAEVSATTVEATQAIQKTVEEVNVKTSIDGKALYKTCAACHGANAEKKALNTSAIIQGWSKDKLIESLKGYQDGTYGGAMKGVMKGQVSKYNDEQLEALAGYISEL